MSNDSDLFSSFSDASFVPLYEAKMFWHFDHRWASFSDTDSQLVNQDNKVSPNFLITPRYWIPISEVEQRLETKAWKKQWLLAFRNVSDSRNERTFVTSILPLCGLGNSASVMLVFIDDTKFICCLIANLNSLLLDFIARQKIPGMNINFFMVEQFPVLTPNFYTETDLNFIVPRVLELTYTAYDLKSWAEDLGYHGVPFLFDPDRRAKLRAELDAWYAKAYGLSRDELRYILDPADIMGFDYPSETFRVLKNNELKQFGEYRTRRLVLDAWDKLEHNEL